MNGTQRKPAGLLRVSLFHSFQPCGVSSAHPGERDTNLAWGINGYLSWKWQRVRGQKYRQGVVQWYPQHMRYMTPCVITADPRLANYGLRSSAVAPDRDCREGSPRLPGRSTTTRHKSGRQYGVQWLPCLSTPYEGSGLPAICNRHRREASCHLLATDTWHLLILRWDVSLDVTVGKMLKCQWWLRWTLVCTICYHCTVCTLKSE
jgi:hypothetical protein